MSGKGTILHSKLCIQDMPKMKLEHKSDESHQKSSHFDEMMQVGKDDSSIDSDSQIFSSSSSEDALSISSDSEEVLINKSETSSIQDANLMIDKGEDVVDQDVIAEIQRRRKKLEEILTRK